MPVCVDAAASGLEANPTKAWGCVTHPPSAVRIGLKGVNVENLHWVQATVMRLDYFDC